MLSMGEIQVDLTSGSEVLRGDVSCEVSSSALLNVGFRQMTGWGFCGEGGGSTWLDG